MIPRHPSQSRESRRHDIVRRRWVGVTRSSRGRSLFVDTCWQRQGVRWVRGASGCRRSARAGGSRGHRCCVSRGAVLVRELDAIVSSQCVALDRERAATGDACRTHREGRGDIVGRGAYPESAALTCCATRRADSKLSRRSSTLRAAPTPRVCARWHRRHRRRARGRRCLLMCQCCRVPPRRCASARAALRASSASLCTPW